MTIYVAKTKIVLLEILPNQPKRLIYYSVTICLNTNRKHILDIKSIRNQLYLLVISHKHQSVMQRLKKVQNSNVSLSTSSSVTP